MPRVRSPSSSTPLMSYDKRRFGSTKNEKIPEPSEPNATQSSVLERELFLMKKVVEEKDELLEAQKKQMEMLQDNLVSSLRKSAAANQEFLQVNRRLQKELSSANEQVVELRMECHMLRGIHRLKQQEFQKRVDDLTLELKAALERTSNDLEYTAVQVQESDTECEKSSRRGGNQESLTASILVSITKGLNFTANKLSTAGATNVGAKQVNEEPRTGVSPFEDPTSCLSVTSASDNVPPATSPTESCAVDNTPAETPMPSAHVYLRSQVRRPLTYKEPSSRTKLRQPSAVSPPAYIVVVRNNTPGMSRSSKDLQQVKEDVPLCLGTKNTVYPWLMRGEPTAKPPKPPCSSAPLWRKKHQYPLRPMQASSSEHCASSSSSVVPPAVAMLPVRPPIPPPPPAQPAPQSSLPASSSRPPRRGSKAPVAGTNTSSGSENVTKKQGSPIDNCSPDTDRLHMEMTGRLVGATRTKQRRWEAKLRSNINDETFELSTPAAAGRITNQLRENLEEGNTASYSATRSFRRGTPVRKAAQAVSSYVEPPLNTKMRRT